MADEADEYEKQQIKKSNEQFIEAIWINFEKYKTIIDTIELFYEKANKLIIYMDEYFDQESTNL